MMRLIVEVVWMLTRMLVVDRMVVVVMRIVME